jgi:hypothetical protein
LEDHRVGGNPFPAPGETELFGGRRLDVDPVTFRIDGFGDVVPHHRDMRGQLRPLGNDGRIDIADDETFCAGQPHHVAEQLQAVGPLVCSIGIGEMLPDVTLANGPQNGVGNGVQQHVGIGMAEKARFMRDINPADDASAARHQPMDVIAVSDAHCVSSRYCIENSASGIPTAVAAVMPARLIGRPLPVACPRGL